MDIAVTGATGFVGSALVRQHIQRGDSIRVLVRDPYATARRFPSVHVFRGDLASAETISEDFVADADVLYHCAAEGQDEARMEAINIGGTRALARLAAGKIGRWVQVSSVSVYGAVRAGTITEDSPINPDSLYGRTKTESEAAVLAEGAAGGYEVTIVRPSKILGLGMPDDSLFRLFAMMERGWFCFIGRPHAVMNLIHVDTVATALLLCGTRRSAAGRTYNLSEQISIEELVAIVADEIGVRRPTLRLPEQLFRVLASVFGRLPGVPLTHRRLDAVTLHARFASERITRELAHNPVVSLKAGLRELVRSWKLHR